MGHVGMWCLVLFGCLLVVGLAAGFGIIVSVLAGRGYDWVWDWWRLHGSSYELRNQETGSCDGLPARQIRALLNECWQDSDWQH